MQLDGITVSAIVYELNEKLTGGRVDKIYQPEPDEIIINIRSRGGNYKLYLTASASHPRLGLVQSAGANPAEPPVFCMLLRKHLSGGRVTEITQPDFERIVIISIESLNEMGDMTEKRLIIEIMGKHSNIILTDRELVIMDSVKRVSHDKSSVREVLPGKKYVFPPSKGKKNPLNETTRGFFDTLSNAVDASGVSGLGQAIVSAYNGISPLIAGEICHRARADANGAAGDDEILRAAAELERLFAQIKNHMYEPAVYYDERDKPAAFAVTELTVYAGRRRTAFDSASEMTASFFTGIDKLFRMSQRAADLKRVILNNIERCAKKREMHHSLLNDVKNRETNRLYGELITANIYAIKKGMEEVNVVNYAEEAMPEITIPLDTELTPAENAQKYFIKYGKDKRAYNACLEQMDANDKEIAYFEQLLQAISTCEDEADLNEIRQELFDEGYVKKRAGELRRRRGDTAKKSKPLKFVSGDGFEIYVGKNNRQNEELTLRFASGADMWLHTKNIPGSHVIIRTSGAPVPEATLNEAAHLAAYYSKGKNSHLVPVDMALKKYVKKPNGAKPGMVIYDNYKTAFVTPDEAIIEGLRKG